MALEPSVVWWTLGSVAVLSLISLVGALSLTTRALNRHGVIVALVALAAGTLVGDTFLHILPETVAHIGGFTTGIGFLVMGGFLLMFLFEVGLRWRHTHAVAVDETPQHRDPDAVTFAARTHTHAEPAQAASSHTHAHHHVHTEQPTIGGIRVFGWLNLASDAAHNLIDGAIVAAAFLADTTLGIVTTVAVAAHEIPQELGDFAVLIRSGMRPTRALALNLGSALMGFLGAILVLLMPFDVDTVVSHALPLIGGAFLYIAASDLIPELHHHSRGRDPILIMLFFLVGIAIMWGLLDLESVLPLGEDGHGHAHD